MASTQGVLFPDAIDPAKLCQHCKVKPFNRPRKLCWTCYHRPGVKEKYVDTSKYSRRGSGNVTGKRPKPQQATDTQPGSEERIKVLMERAALGEELHHADDLKCEAPVGLTSMIARSLRAYRVSDVVPRMGECVKPLGPVATVTEKIRHGRYKTAKRKGEL